MNLRLMHRIILKTHGRETLELSSIALTESLLEKDEITNAVTGCDRFNSANRSDDFERLPNVHVGRLP